MQLIEILAPATHRTILTRMLRNLNGLYQQHGRLGARGAHLRPAAEAVAGNAGAVARPRPGLSRAGLRHAARARTSARYLQKLPNADDAETVRAALIDLGGVAARQLTSRLQRSERHHLEVGLGDAAIRAAPSPRGCPPSACPARCPLRAGRRPRRR